MNKTFKVVFNKARGALMVANEVTSSVQKKGVKTVVAIAVATACGAAAAATSYDNGIVANSGEVTEGSASEAVSITITGDTNSKAVLASNKSTLTLQGQTITINAPGTGVRAEGNATVKLGTTDTNLIDITDGSIGIIAREGHVEVTGKTLKVTSSASEAFGLHAQNNTQNETAPQGAASLTVTTDETIVTNEKGLGLSAFSNGQLTINSNLSVTAINAIDVRGYSTTNINTDGEHTTKLIGDVVFETPNTSTDSQGSGNLIDANVNVVLSGQDSYWTSVPKICM